MDTLSPRPVLDEPARGQLALPGLAAAPPRRPRLRAPAHRARASGLTRARRTGRQAQRVIAFLRAHGPQTDHQLADGLSLPLASVNSLRNALVKAGRVGVVDVVPGPFGALRTRWGLR